MDKAYADFDLTRFEQAWNALIARHDMLRMVIDSDGRQRILHNTPWYRLPRNDLRDLPAEQQQQRLLDIREDMSIASCPPTAGRCLKSRSANSTPGIAVCT